MKISGESQLIQEGVDFTSSFLKTYVEAPCVENSVNPKKKHYTKRGAGYINYNVLPWEQSKCYSPMKDHDVAIHMTGLLERRDLISHVNTNIFFQSRRHLIQTSFITSTHVVTV